MDWVHGSGPVEAAVCGLSWTRVVGAVHGPPWTRASGLWSTVSRDRSDGVCVLVIVAVDSQMDGAGLIFLTGSPEGRERGNGTRARPSELVGAPPGVEQEGCRGLGFPSAKRRGAHREFEDEVRGIGFVMEESGDGGGTRRGGGFGGVAGSGTERE